MMPKNKIGRHMMAKLKLYCGPNHPHQAQCPIPLEPMSGRPIPAGALFVTSATAKEVASTGSAAAEIPQPPADLAAPPVTSEA